MADGISAEIDSIVTGSGVSNQPTFGQTTWPVRYVNAPGTNLPILGYTGPGLVGFSNDVEEENYVITEGLVRDVYSSLLSNRQSTLQQLKDYGFYPQNRNVGDTEADLNAIAQWLDEANLQGVTRERYLAELAKTGRKESSGGGGAPRRYRVSNPDDLKAVFKRVAQETIGRGFTDEEANQAVAAYQQREIQAQQQLYAGGVATEQPAADVFAQGFAQQIAPTEANGYKFLGVMNRIFNATTGGR